MKAFPRQCPITRRAPGRSIQQQEWQRIAEALETNAVFVAATRQPMARRFPAKPQAVRRNRFIRAIVCACAAFRREIQQ